ncbi:hypothetical protein FQA47_019331, partial [Oryzias melastigma]
GTCAPLPTGPAAGTRAFTAKSGIIARLDHEDVKGLYAEREDAGTQIDKEVRVSEQQEEEEEDEEATGAAEDMRLK